jgi:hypothetical protein
MRSKKELLLRTTLPYRFTRDQTGLEILFNRDYEEIYRRHNPNNNVIMDWWFYFDGCKPWEFKKARTRCEVALELFLSGQEMEFTV